MTLPDGWKKCNFSAVAKLAKGISYSASDYCDEGSGHAFITIKCFSKGGGYSDRGIKYYSGDFKPEQRVESGDLIIANTDLTRGGDIIGSPLIVPNKFSDTGALISMDLSKIIYDQDKVCAEFLYYTLKTKFYRNYMQSRSGGSTVLHLHTKSIPKMPLTLPPLSEQREISIILGGVDTAIEATQSVIDQTAQAKIALMNELLTCGLSGKHKKFKQSPLGDVPEGWDVRSLGTLFDLVERRVDMDDDEEYQLVTVKRRNGGVVERERLPGKKIKVKNQYWIEEGDFLISKRQIVHGACEIVPAPLSGAIVSNEYHTLRAKDDLYLPYFRWVSRAAFMYRYFLISSVGVHIEKMLFKLDQWLKLEIPLPPLDEQKKITEILESTENSAAANQARLEQIQKLKTALMQVLLTGKVRVPAAEQSEPQNQRREAANG